MARKKKENSTVITNTAIKDFYPKGLVIRAIKWATGMSELDARQAYRNTCAQFHNLTVHDYQVYGMRRSIR